MKSVASAVFEVVGLGLVAVGCGLIALWLGLVVAGVGLVGLGLALDPPRRTPQGSG